MIVRIVSYLPDFGNFVMKSIAIVWNGSPFTGVMGNIVGFKGWVLILLAWQAAHPLTYCLASCFMLGHHVTLGPGVRLNVRFLGVALTLGLLLFPLATQVCGKRVFGMAQGIDVVW